MTQSLCDLYLNEQMCSFLLLRGHGYDCMIVHRMKLSSFSIFILYGSQVKRYKVDFHACNVFCMICMIFSRIAACFDADKFHFYEIVGVWMRWRHTFYGRDNDHQSTMRLPNIGLRIYQIATLIIRSHLCDASNESWCTDWTCRVLTDSYKPSR